jgi:hypothetical protein
MFPESVRGIFQYEYQGQLLHADPIRILRLLSIHTGGRLTQLVEDARHLQDRTKEDGPPAAQPGTPEYQAGKVAVGILADATTQAFGLAPFDPYTGEGTLEAEALELLATFTRWMQQKKTPGGTSA